MNFSILQHDPSSQEDGGSPGGAQSCLEEVASAEEQKADNTVGDQRKGGSSLAPGDRKGHRGGRGGGVLWGGGMA